eukprot:m.62562 g.62562  ORF g.62562 m.62562 type:complete len:142 (-) comp11518_c0_seq1:97-522(-)
MVWSIGEKLMNTCYPWLWLKPKKHWQTSRKSQQLQVMMRIVAYCLQSTPLGLRAIYIGPSDLSVSMGYKPGCDRTEPEVLEAISVIRQACKDAGIYVALHCDNPTYAHQALKKDGIDLVSLSTDVRLLAKIAASELAIIRQ